MPVIIVSLQCLTLSTSSILCIICHRATDHPCENTDFRLPDSCSFSQLVFALFLTCFVDLNYVVSVCRTSQPLVGSDWCLSLQKLRVVGVRGLCQWGRAPGRWVWLPHQNGRRDSTEGRINIRWTLCGFSESPFLMHCTISTALILILHQNQMPLAKIWMCQRINKVEKIKLKSHPRTPSHTLTAAFISAYRYNIIIICTHALLPFVRGYYNPLRG